MRLRRDEVVCMTHGPGPWCERGKSYTTLDGRAYVITRIKEVGPTALLGGGSHPCWAIYGRFVNAKSGSRAEQKPEQ